MFIEETIETEMLTKSAKENAISLLLIFSSCGKDLFATKSLARILGVKKM